MSRIYAPLVSICAILLAASIARAQVTTGAPPFGSIAGGSFDAVNLANLNVHFGIPVIAKAGRGLPLTYVQAYESSVWYPVGVSGSQHWQPVDDQNWGWRGITEAAVGLVGFSTSRAPCPSGPARGTLWSNWVYHDAYGTPHPFDFSFTDTTNCIPEGQGGSADGTATDGSGYYMSADSSPSATVRSRSGDTILALSTLSGTVTDSNGNQLTAITASGTTYFTDTLGTPALSVSGTAPNPRLLTYTNYAGAPVSATMNYSNKTVQTNFGCGIGEWGPFTRSLVSSISLPDQSSYTITYEPTPGVSGAVTGRIASIQLPTGGTIRYDYSGGSNGITCIDGSTATLTRTTPDGVWKYEHSESGTAWTTTVTDPTTPTANQSVYNFQGIYETQRKVYQGSSGTGTLLETVDTCYNGAAIPCTGTSVTLPILNRTVQTTLPGLSPSKTYTTYNTYGLPTGVDEYDYGPTLVRKKVIVYALLSNNIADRPSSVTVYKSDGTTVVAQTTYTYDEGTPTQTTGTPQHVGVTGSRGNPTTVKYTTQGSSTISRTFAYFDTGLVQTATDVNGAQTTYGYNSTGCANSLLTDITLPISPYTRSMAWNCTGGVIKSVTDENGKQTTYTNNDPYWRLTAIADPTTATTNISYSTNPFVIESTLNFNGTTSTVDTRTQLDGLGRVHLVQRKQSQGATTYDSIQTDYDSLGRAYRTSPPYSAAAGVEYGGTFNTTAYDPLDRPTQVTDAGGGSVSLTHAKNDVQRELSPAPTGENTKRRQYEYDGLGRLTSVCEITGASGSGACGQNTAATGYFTSYSYNELDKLTGVSQSGQSRTYAYDALGRLTSEQNPESGTKNYVYDTDSSMCGNGPYTSNGDLVKITDASGNCVMRYYDSLHRLTDVGNNNQALSHCKRFRYDNSPGYPGSTKPAGLTNTLGRLIEAATSHCDNTGDAIITDEWFGYSARGEVTDVYEKTPNSGGYYHVTATYWENGLSKTLGGVGLPTINYTADGEGRVNAVNAASGQNPVSSTTYNVFGLPTGVSLGSGDADAFTYDPNTGRMTEYVFDAQSGKSQTISDLTWNPNGSLGQLVVSHPFILLDPKPTCTYGYDDLARLASVNCVTQTGGTVWNQTFGFDPFGNLSKNGTISFEPTYTDAGKTNNRVVTLPGYPTPPPPAYDASGNLTNDSVHTYSWDAEGKMLSADTTGLTYDALGRAVELANGSAYTQIVYGPLGQKLALMNGQTLSRAFVPLPAGGAAVYGPSGLSYYRHADWQGSSRFASNPDQTLYYGGAYAPYGENYAETGTQDRSFTGQNQDTVSSGPYPLYDFLYREYHPTWGRWLNPDPAGLSAVDLSNPQSLNRYAYVLNNPTSLVDPLGLSCENPNDGKPCVVNVTGKLPPPIVTVNYNPLIFNRLGDNVPWILEREETPRLRDPYGTTPQPTPDKKPASNFDLLGTLGEVFSGGRLPGQTYVGCVEENIKLTTRGLVKSSTKTLGVGVTGLVLTAAKSPAGGFSLSEYLLFRGMEAVQYIIPGFRLPAALTATELGSQVPAVAGGAALGLFAGSLANCASQRVGQ